MLDNILKALRKPVLRSSTELRGDLTKIDQAALEAEVDRVEARRRGLLLTGTEAEIDAATADLGRANLAAERAQAAVEELKRQIADAEKRERLEEIHRRAADAREAQVKIMRAYVELHDAATRVALLLGSIQASERVIREANALTAAAGRQDLKVNQPRNLLMLHLNLTDSQLPDPTEWLMRGYWPVAPIDGGFGATIAVPLRADLRFDRMRDLLPAAGRKAA